MIKERVHENALVIGMCLGMLIGTAIGVATDNIAFWLPVGVPFGMLLGYALSYMSNNYDEREIEIRELSEEEIPAALDLAWKVFVEYETPDYSREGSEEFEKCLCDEEYLEGISYYGSFDRNKLMGVIGARPDTGHICFFFVDGKYHRRGIGTRLFEVIRNEFEDQDITVNSSPFGVAFYHALGFEDTDEEQTVNGIRFIPMRYENYSSEWSLQPGN